MNQQANSKQPKKNGNSKQSFREETVAQYFKAHVEKRNPEMIRHNTWRLYRMASVVLGTLFLLSGDLSAETNQAAGTSVALSPTVQKESQSKKIVPMVTKQVSGEVAGVSNFGFAVSLGNTEPTGSDREMWLPFSEEMTLTNYKSKKDIQDGDKVDVTYEETKEGGFKRAVKSIRFLRRAPQEDALVSS